MVILYQCVYICLQIYAAANGCSDQLPHGVAYLKICRLNFFLLCCVCMDISPLFMCYSTSWCSYLLHFSVNCLLRPNDYRCISDTLQNVALHQVVSFDWYILASCRVPTQRIPAVFPQSESEITELATVTCWKSTVFWCLGLQAACIAGSGGTVVMPLVMQCFCALDAGDKEEQHEEKNKEEESKPEAADKTEEN